MFIQNDLQSTFQKLQCELTSLGNHTSHVENKMVEMITAHNEIVDVTNAMEEEIAVLKIKIADMEDCDRHNNILLRGIPELVKTEVLKSFLTDMFVCFPRHLQ